MKSSLSPGLRIERFGSVRVCCGLLTSLLVFLAATSRAEPAMWVIRDKDSTIYLIGTLHLLRHEADWKSPKVSKAVAESTDLWLEVSDPEDQAAIIPLIQRYGYDREKPLSSKLTDSQKEKLGKIAGEYNVPLPTIEPMKPWLAGLIFTALPLQKAGFDPNAGVDRSLKTQASKEGDKIHGFETLEQQVQFLAELSESDQVAFLNDTLDDVSQGIALFDKLATAWINGDTKTINDFFIEELKAKAPSIYEKLVVQRNVRWSDKILELLRGSGVQLVAVGAGHLVGPDSVQAQLAKKGIKAEPY